ncbi:DUF2190 domain-containing protein [Azonexus sp. R2A61]|uniref:DUF2190 domain-containing protein n=1 Tax=Azonexus sp. R2A61 TaxID=2744443 RepID=UPI001F45464C|nr:DUF2190 domain-containing protein [Azonexus sp. R2A61]
MQYEKVHSTTRVLTAAVLAARFVAYNGAHASAAAGGTADAQGVSEMAGDAGQAIPVITGYSAIAEASAAISAGAYVKPAADGSGRAVTGSATDHCGRALTAASGAGDLFEVEILTHVHP